MQTMMEPTVEKDTTWQCVRRIHPRMEASIDRIREEVRWKIGQHLASLPLDQHFTVKMTVETRRVPPLEPFAGPWEIEIVGRVEIVRVQYRDVTIAVKTFENATFRNVGRSAMRELAYRVKRKLMFWRKP